jgi:hypothetical protein
MFLESPHLRFEGLYVSRNTYIRQGVAEWKRERTCHLVTYFRYFRCAAVTLRSLFARVCSRAGGVVCLGERVACQP